MRIFGIILAGGQGRRMGGADKAFLDLGGLPLVRHVHDRFGPQVEQLAFSANGNPARFDGFSVPILIDAVPQGPLSGILAAMDWAASAGADAVVSAPVDAPFLPCDLVPRLLLAAGAGMAIATSNGRDHPVFALWPVRLRAALREFLASGEKARVATFADRQSTARAEFPHADAFLNLNTPQDLVRAHDLVRGAG